MSEYNEAEINKVFIIGQNDAIKEEQIGTLDQRCFDATLWKWWKRGYESQWRLLRAIAAERAQRDIEAKIDQEEISHVHSIPKMDDGK